jgi:hypothetical protein
MQKRKVATNWLNTWLHSTCVDTSLGRSDCSEHMSETFIYINVSHCIVSIMHQYLTFMKPIVYITKHCLARIKYGKLATKLGIKILCISFGTGSG